MEQFAESLDPPAGRRQRKEKDFFFEKKAKNFY
jgi:hypothetical protein